MTGGEQARRVVLAGGGHAHLYILKRVHEFVSRGIEFIVVAPDDFWYSGLATGVLGGIYPPELDQIDIGHMVEQQGGTFIRDRVTSIDAKEKTVHLEKSSSVCYDALSLNLGSRVPLEAIPGAAQHGYPVKPVRWLWELRQQLERAFADSARRDPVRVVVVGAGATGCEIAANVCGLAESRGGNVEITVLSRGDSALGQMPPGVGRLTVRLLERRGIRFRLRSAVRGVSDTTVELGDGTTIPYDALVWAIGLTPPALLRSSGLPVDEEGALRVDGFLRSVGDPNIFGGGDCIRFEPADLPNIGVFAVRQGPILHSNLLASVTGAPLEQFTPQRRWLLILNLGDKTGLATWGALYWHSRLAFRLKDRIDRRFLDAYRA